MYEDKLKQLDEIIKTTLDSIKESKDEITDISSFAKEEYMTLEEEFAKLRIEANVVIENVDSLHVNLKECKKELAYRSKNHDKFSEKDIEEIYHETDEIRVRLAVEKEKENSIIKRRNDLEIHLKNIRKISEKADALSSNFRVAATVINGELSKIGQEVEDINKVIDWGVKALQIQELERKRIARDMHDGPTQSLTNLVIRTEYCIRLIDSDIDKTKLELQTLKNLIRATIDETRRIIYNLRPMLIDDLGLTYTIKAQIDKFQKENDIKVKSKINDKDEVEVPEIITLTLYRVVQEAFNNIRKHSKASMITIEIVIKNCRINMSIIDNGVGFDIKNKNTNKTLKGGYGLTMMEERVKYLGGRVIISSEINGGTLIDVEVPIIKKERKNE